MYGEHAVSWHELRPPTFYGFIKPDLDGIKKCNQVFSMRCPIRAIACRFSVPVIHVVTN